LPFQSRAAVMVRMGSIMAVEWQKALRAPR
jgi:hypothetical protein